RRHRVRVTKNRDLVYDALIALHARACRTAKEGHYLLSGGYPQAALSRARTLHEIAVTMLVISEYGREPGHESLAERFLLHYHITNMDGVKVSQSRAAALGLRPFSPAEVATFQRKYDKLVARFGAEYKQSYGWALGVINVYDGFRGLEVAAGTDQLRGYYKWA